MEKGSVLLLFFVILPSVFAIFNKNGKAQTVFYIVRFSLSYATNSAILDISLLTMLECF